MKYDFSTPIDRRRTDSEAIVGMQRALGRTDLIPLWIADMDFATPPFVMRVVERRLRQQILGYTCSYPSYYRAIAGWCERRYGFHINESDIHFVPGIVPAICFAENCLTQPGDKVMTLTPVYHPFRHVTEASGRIDVQVPLIVRDGRFYMDYDAIDRELADCRLLLLCNPHNPGGTSWTQDEIVRIVKLCRKHNVIIVSDEIHADLTYAPHKHVPTAMSCPEARDITLTFMAPTKVFNFPGLIASHVIATGDELRRRFFDYLDGNDIGNGSVFAYDAVEACYSDEGEEWLSQLTAYISANIDYVISFLADHCPGIRPMRPEASFLIFLDHSSMHFPSQEALTDFYINGAGLYLNDGTIFGPTGRNFMRLNVGMPRCILEQAMSQLAAAYDRLPAEVKP